MDNEMILSVVVTAHHEGLLAHKTMRSVEAALEPVRMAGYRYEIIIHIDNGDKKTLEYFARYKNKEGIRIFENSFGDTGPSRNYAVSKAKGKYVAFLDGDDLISDNWYINALKMLMDSHEKIIVHPEAILTFGIDQQNILTLQEDSREDNSDLVVLIGENKWCSVLMAEKEILQKVCYRKLGTGYGHEDYVFNVDALNEGFKHRIAKGTVLFYRRTDNSRLSNAVTNRVVIPYLDLFAFDNINKQQKELEKTKTSLKEYGYKTYKKIRNNDALNFFITPVAKIVLKILNRGTEMSKSKKVPGFVVREWEKINKIETQLYPYKDDVKKVISYDPKENIGIGKAFCKISNDVTIKPDYVFIVPWVVRGGADKVLINYIKAIKENNPDWHFAVITTLPVKNTWKKMLPEGVDLVDFGNNVTGLPPDMQDTVFSRVLTQLNCKKVHIINSEYGYKWVINHKDLVKHHYELNISLFCGEFIPESNLKGRFSYDDPFLCDIFDAVNKVFTDNATIIKETINHNGFGEEKFKVHYQPVADLRLTPPKEEVSSDGKTHILWAGRIVPTKMPDMVVKIGEHLNPDKYVIDVYGEFSRDVDKNLFSGIPTIKYRGPFDGFFSLSTDKYDLLLYTSLDDGLPNIILEAAVAGLPIIASNDGGVGEFVKNKKTGLLVENYLDYKAFLAAIHIASSNHKEMLTYAKNAQKLIKERHDWQTFVRSVKKDIV